MVQIDMCISKGVNKVSRLKIISKRRINKLHFLLRNRGNFIRYSFTLYFFVSFIEIMIIAFSSFVIKLHVKQFSLGAIPSSVKKNYQFSSSLELMHKLTIFEKMVYEPIYHHGLANQNSRIIAITNDSVSNNRGYIMW